MLLPRPLFIATALWVLALGTVPCAVGSRLRTDVGISKASRPRVSAPAPLIRSTEQRRSLLDSESGTCAASRTISGVCSHSKAVNSGFDEASSLEQNRTKIGQYPAEPGRRVVVERLVIQQIIFEPEDNSHTPQVKH